MKPSILYAIIGVLLVAVIALGVLQFMNGGGDGPPSAAPAEAPEGMAQAAVDVMKAT